MGYKRSYGSVAFHDWNRVYIRDMVGVVNGEDGLPMAIVQQYCCVLLIIRVIMIRQIDFCRRGIIHISSMLHIPLLSKVVLTTGYSKTYCIPQYGLDQMASQIDKSIQPVRIYSQGYDEKKTTCPFGRLNQPTSIIRC